MLVNKKQEPNNLPNFAIQSRMIHKDLHTLKRFSWTSSVYTTVKSEPWITQVYEWAQQRIASLLFLLSSSWIIFPWITSFLFYFSPWIADLCEQWSIPLPLTLPVCCSITSFPPSFHRVRLWKRWKVFWEIWTPISACHNKIYKTRLTNCVKNFTNFLEQLIYEVENPL